MRAVAPAFSVGWLRRLGWFEVMRQLIASPSDVGLQRGDDASKSFAAAPILQDLCEDKMSFNSRVQTHGYRDLQREAVGQKERTTSLSQQGAIKLDGFGILLFSVILASMSGRSFGRKQATGRKQRSFERAEKMSKFAAYRATGGSPLRRLDAP